MSWRQRADEALAWEECGDPDAPLVLCLHGFPDHPPSFRPLAARLGAAGYRVAAPYLPGYHPSPARAAPDAAALGQWTIAAAARLSPGRPVHLVGHDWGAVACYAAMALLPARFCSALTLAVPHPLALLHNLARHPAQLGRSWYMLFFQLPAVPERALRAGDFSLVHRLWRRWSPGLRLDPPARAALEQCLAASGSAPIDYYRALRRAPALLTSGLRAKLAAIATPTYVLHGADDGCIGAELGRGQQRFFGGPVTTEVIAGVGHFMQLEAPEHIAARAVAFFAAHGAEKE